MVIGGFVKFSLNDFPGKASAVIFTRSCNMRCGFCHNPELVLPERYAPEIRLDEVFSFLEGRRGKLDGVCISGGEPTQHNDLGEILGRIKEMGFFTKIDTNGSRPDFLEEILSENLLDYIAMDIKAPFEKYKEVCGIGVSSEKIKESINLIMSSGLPHEFRTTVIKSLISLDDLRQIAAQIKGAENYFLQKFIPAAKLINPAFLNENSYTEDELNTLASELKSLVKNCSVR